MIVGNFVIDNIEKDGEILNAVWVNRDNYKAFKPVEVFSEYTRAVSYVRELDSREKKRLEWVDSRQCVEKFFDDANKLMLQHFNERQLHTILKEELSKLREKKADGCDSWKDSGDRGACFAYEVKPIDNTIKEVEEISEEIKKANAL